VTYDDIHLLSDDIDLIDGSRNVMPAEHQRASSYHVVLLSGQKVGQAVHADT
jgi:hypothetical protein